MSATPSQASPDMPLTIDPARAKVLAENLHHVSQRIQSAANGRKVRLIAVSKLKPANDILSLHTTNNNHDSSPSPGHLDFGENYAQELTTKASLLPRTIRWHMIGGLQTNKCKPLAEEVVNLYCVSSVDTAKKADALEKGRASLVERMRSENNNGGGEGEDVGRLRVLVQVNTSGEESKSGVSPGEETTSLCRHIRDACPHLQLAGLMTIGAIARSQASSGGGDAVNEDFVCLKETRDRVAGELGVGVEELELSMGMSSDFEEAVGAGSAEVRVGTGIFGERPARKDAKMTVGGEEGTG